MAECSIIIPYSAIGSAVPIGTKQHCKSALSPAYSRLLVRKNNDICEKMRKNYLKRAVKPWSREAVKPWSREAVKILSVITCMSSSFCKRPWNHSSLQHTLCDCPDNEACILAKGDWDCGNLSTRLNIDNIIEVNMRQCKAHFENIPYSYSVKR